MFKLPWWDSPDRLMDVFNFKKFTYDVCFEEVEGSLSFFGLGSKMKKRYYIASTSKSSSNVRRYLAYCPDGWETYFFIEANQTPDFRKIIYWNNASDPINLITYMKGKLDEESQNDFVVFSSTDLE